MRIQHPVHHSSRIELKRLWLPGFIMVGISILSGSAGIQTGGWSFAGIDKIGHLGVFGLLSIAWARSFREHALARWQRFLCAVILTTAFGLVDEMHQYHNPLRTFEWADLLADFAGSLLAGCAYLYLKPIQQILETEIWQFPRLPLINNKTDSSP